MKITITETKTIRTEIEVDADSIEQAEKFYNEQKYRDKLTEAEMRQWGVEDTDVEFSVSEKK